MGWRWIAAAGLVVAGLVGVGLFVLAGRGGDDGSAGPPVPTSTTASMGHGHRPGEDGMPPPGGGVGPANPLTCAPTFASATRAAPSASSPSPGGATAVAPPSADCLEVGGACVVSFSMSWSDGHVEGATRSLDRPGEVTLEGDRGATATFTVDAADVCTAPTITYHPTWPAG
jgi:hypothetical protein